MTPKPIWNDSLLNKWYTKAVDRTLPKPDYNNLQPLDSWGRQIVDISKGDWDKLSGEQKRKAIYDC